jgi:hypothetical protein
MAAVRECPSWHIQDHVWAGSCMGRTAMFVKPTGSRKIDRTVQRLEIGSRTVERLASGPGATWSWLWVGLD